MKISNNYLLYCIVILLISSCTKIDDTKLFSKMPSSKTGIKFKNLVTETDDFNILTYGNIYNGGGVAAGDVNNDGLVDLYFTGSMVGSRLYINQGDFEFKEIAKEAGVFAAGLWNTGTSMADVNGDGFLDIYICRSATTDPEKRRNVLFINNGDLTFTEKSKEYGLDDSGYSTEGTFFDFDRDGDLDVFLVNHSIQPYSSFRGTSQKLREKKIPDLVDKLYRNDNGKFTDISEEAGITSSVLGFGLSAKISDINNDQWPDIYLSNDFHEHDFLYINNGNGTFTERLKDYMGHTSHFSMGADIADINNDEKPDIITVDMLPEGNFRQKMVLGPDNYDKYKFLVNGGFHHQYMRNMLHLNQGDSFSEIGQFSGVHSTDWSWSPLLADFDNDGFKDLFVTNGVKRDYTNMDFMNYAVQKRLEEMDKGTEPAVKDLLENMPAIIEHNYSYKNNGDLTFKKTTDEWGLNGKSLSNGAAYADLDNDGDLDLIVNNTDLEASIYRNNANIHTQNHYIKLRLKGEGKNTNAIGTKVIVKLDTTSLYQELYPVRGFQSSIDPALIFGLGSINKIDQIKVIWPDGKVTTQKNIESNQTIVIEQSMALVNGTTISKPSVKTIFTKVVTDSLLNFAHKENNFNDFDRETLLLHKLSTQGPKLATADINGDGLTDYYIGGAKDQAGKLYIQNRNGTYRQSSSFQKDTQYEDTGAVFFDANGDSKPDLYVTSGGNEEEAGHENYEDRLYLNQGNGSFSKKTNALPNDLFSTSCVVPSDIDQDGDLDLFVGARLIPGLYPKAPASKLYLNNGNGKYSDATSEILGKNDEMGMVTNAVWNDLNLDGFQDLIVVGEFTPIRFFLNQNGKLSETTALKDPSKSTGWWNTIEPTDIDGDGDIDFIAGNFGENSQITASYENPATLFAKDFDNNGSLDPILCNYLQGKNYPIFSKDDLSNQLNFIKAKYVNYRDYATQSITDIFGKEELEDAIKLEARLFKSVILRNNGKGQFDIEPLPTEVQFAPVYSIVSFDIDYDEDQDLLLFGNFFGTRSRYGRYDANHGIILRNNGQGKFSVIDQLETGMKIMGEVRDAKIIKNNDNETLLAVAQNNGPLLLYKLQNH